MAGQALTSGQGSIGPSVSVALAGAAIALSLGVIVGASGGQQITSSQGSVTQSAAVVLAGTEVTVGQGTISYGGSGQLTLTGQAITSGQGSVGTFGEDVTVNVSGVEAEFFAGEITVGPQTLVGIASTSASGTQAPSLTLALVGSGIAASSGTVAPGIEAAEDTYITSSSGTVTLGAAVAISGSEITSGSGTLTPTGDGFAELTGVAVTVEAGTVEVSESYALSGQQIVSAQQPMGAPGGAELTGSAVAVEAGFVFLDADRTYALTGIEIAVDDGSCFASPVCFYSGQTITVGQQQIGPVNAALTGASMTIEAGEVGAPSSGLRPGKSKKRILPDRKRLVVTVDDEDFIVESKEEAEELLRSARELYVEQVAKADAQLKTSPRTVSIKQVKVPKIRATGPDTPERAELIAAVAELRKEMKQMQEETVAAIRKARQDDEEAIALLL